MKKLIELKRPVEVRLDQEMKRNIELQKECHRYGLISTLKGDPIQQKSNFMGLECKNR